MNFDKKNFSKILIEIKNSYGSLNQMAEKTGITSAYLSKLIRLMYNNAPSPEVLKKIADNSNGIISYYQLMVICGYVDYDNINIDKIIDDFFKEYPDARFSISLADLKNRTNEENKVLNKLFQNYRNIIMSNNYSRINYKSITKDLSKLSKQKIDIIWGIYITYLINIVNSFQIPSSIHETSSKSANIYNNKIYMCPVYGRIAAGEPNWAEECMEGKMPIDPELMNIINPEECYFLRVNGESMNKIIKNGAFALIRKTDWVENGEIAVVLVNGFDATLKKFTKQGDLVILEPMSNDPSFQTQVYGKDTEIKIIGKYIGKMEMN